MTSWAYWASYTQGKRASQQDDFGVFELPSALGAGDLMLVLADGMGGERAGARASAIAVQAFIGSYDAVVAATIPQRLQRTLHHTNRQVARQAASDPGNLRGMGCTLLAVVLDAEGFYWVSVGDSPLWLWRKGRLLRLNQDHSYRQVLAQRVANGLISRREALNHPDRNALTSALTGEPLGEVDLRTHPYGLEAGDQIVLASDGLFTLTENEIARHLGRGRDREDPCQRLLAAVTAKDAAHQDNTTVMVVRVSSDN